MTPKQPTVSRREIILQLAGLGCTTPTFADSLAEATRLSTIVVPFSAGGPTDVFARLLSEVLSQSLSRRFNVETRPGSSGLLASNYVAQAPADGHTLLMIDSTPVVYRAISKVAARSFTEEILPIGGFCATFQILVLRQGLQVRTLQELLQLLGDYPGQFTAGIPGWGSPPHLATELLMKNSGVTFTIVPYKGASGIVTDLIGEHIDFAFLSTGVSRELVASGQLIGLGTTASKRRSPVLDLPSLSDQLGGTECMSWFGLGAPRNIRAESAEPLELALTAAHSLPAVGERLALLGAESFPLDGRSLAAHIESEESRWAHFRFHSDMH